MFLYDTVTFDKQTAKMARRGVPNEDLSNIEFETSEEVEVVPTFNSMVSNRMDCIFGLWILMPIHKIHHIFRDIY